MSTLKSVHSKFVEDDKGLAFCMKIPGECVPKGRPRFTRQGHTYTPKKTADYESYLATCFKTAELQPTERAVELEITVYRQVLKSWSAKKKSEAVSGGVPAITRPDVDNYIKSILDAGNGLLFKDDSQVVKLTVSKRYAYEPHIIIKMREFNHDQ